MLCTVSLSGGHVVGNFPPHEAFTIGGTNSVRGYEEGAVGSGRSYTVGSGEISFPVVCGENGLSFLFHFWVFTSICAGHIMFDCYCGKLSSLYT